MSPATESPPSPLAALRTAPAYEWCEQVRCGLLFAPLAVAGWCVAGEYRQALTERAASHAAVAEAGRPGATLASVSAAAALASGDARWQERNRVWLQVNTGAGFRWDATGELLARAPRGAEFRVRISPLEGVVAQELRK